MRTLLFNLLFLMFAAIATLQAQSKQTSIIVFEPQEVSPGILDPSLKTQLREEIGYTVMNDSKAYTLVEWSNIVQLLDLIIQQTNSAVFDEQKVVQVGKMSGAEKVIYTTVLSSSDGFYQVYAKQLNVETGIVEKQGNGKVRCREYLHLAVRQAASVFADNPEAAMKKVEKEIKQACPEEEFTRRPPRKNLFQEIFGVKIAPNRFGLTVSYDQRERLWENLADGTTENLDYWGQPALLGARFGFRYDRYLAPSYAGVGLSAGLSAGYHSLNSIPSTEEEEPLRFREISLRLPVMAMYRVDFNQHIGVFVEYGVYADVGLYAHMMDAGGETYTDIYGNESGGHMERFRYGLQYGAGVQTDHLMLGASAGRSLSNTSGDPSGKVRERNFTLSLTLMF
jgi:hypothetical protein